MTISGTDRFGLLEPNIVKLLEELPGADLCSKYNFKFKNINPELIPDSHWDYIK